MEVLPFHRLGAHKYQALGVPFRCADTDPPSPEQVDRVRQEFRNRGLAVC